jgi:hypothetical protein
MLDLNNLKNEINLIPQDNPVFIYIGVGVAASDKNYLPPAQYQQFPPFLQDLYNQLPNLHLFLLLFDPQQENPPRVAVDYELYNIHNDQCHYSSLNGQLQTYVYRQTVYTQPDLNHPAEALNLTATLRELNQFAKDKNISLLYHDFTGRKTALLADYFDHENTDHLDQLIYGLSGREDHGCFFDLTHETAYFPYHVYIEPNNRPVVKMFNYYKYIVNQTYAASASDLQVFPQSMYKLAEAQKKQILNVIRTQFKTTHLSVLRHVRKSLLETQALAEHMPCNIFDELPLFYRNMFTELFHEKEYSLLYELLFNYISSQLDIVAQLNEMPLSGEELLSFITLDHDPYKWYNAIKGLI